MKLKAILLISLLLGIMFVFPVSAFNKEVHNFDRIWYSQTNGFNKNGDGTLILAVTYINNSFRMIDYCSIEFTQNPFYFSIEFQDELEIQRDSEGNIIYQEPSDGYIFLRKSVVDTYIPKIKELATRGVKYKTITFQSVQWYRIYVPDFNSKYEWKQYQNPVKDEEWYTWGNSNSISFNQKAMFVKQTKETQDSIEFDFFHPTDNSGQNVSFSKSYLLSKGIITPFFEWGEKIPWKVIPYTQNITHYFINPEHFSIIGIHEATSGEQRALIVNTTSDIDEKTIYSQGTGNDGTAWGDRYETFTDNWGEIDSAKIYYHSTPVAGSVIVNATVGIADSSGNWIVNINENKSAPQCGASVFSADYDFIDIFLDNSSTYRLRVIIHWSQRTNLYWNHPPQNTYAYGHSDIHATNDYRFVLYGYANGSYVNTTRSVGSSAEQNVLNGTLLQPFSNNECVVIIVPVSNSVQGITEVLNQTTMTAAANISSLAYLINNTFYYDSINQFVYIGTGNLSTGQLINWSVNCTYSGTFAVMPPTYLRSGDNFAFRGLIKDKNDIAISGHIATMNILNSTDTTIISSQWNCSNGNYECDIATTPLIAGLYGWQLEFYDVESGVSFKKGGPLWIDTVIPGGNGSSGPYASAHLYYSFFDLNTGTGLDDNFFKFYISPDTTFNEGDRVKGGMKRTELGETLYYRILDFFNNTIYPFNVSYSTVFINEAETYIDCGVNMRQFRVKNMNESTIYFIIRNDTTDLQVGRWIPPYEEATYFLLDNTYNLTLQYYNSATAVLEQTVYVPSFVIDSDTFYWIPGYSLADIVIVVNNANMTIMDQIINIGVNINNDGSTVINQVLNSNVLLSNIDSNISLQHIDTRVLINNTHTDISQQVNSVWFSVNNTNTTMVDQANLIKQTITNTESNITNQINGVLQNVTNTNTTVVNQANLVLQQITNTEANITTQVNSVWQDINNSNATITNQLNFINQTILNVNTNLTTQVNIIKQDILNMNSSISFQLNTLSQNITNMNSSIDTQLNAVSQDIYNMNNTVHIQLNSVSQEINNFRANITSQVNSVWASINNSNSSILYQLNVITADITNMNASIDTQLNFINTKITNTESNITTQLNYIDINITNMNVSLDNQINNIGIQIANMDSSLSTQINAVLTEIINTNMSIVDQVNLIWTSINNTNASIHTQVTGVHTTITTMWSDVNYSFNAVITNISFHHTNITYLIEDMNATLLAHLINVLDNVSENGSSVFSKVLEVLDNISNLNISINGSKITEILNLTQEIQQTIISNFSYIDTRLDIIVSQVDSRTQTIIDAIDNINITGYNDMMSLLQGILEQFELPHEWRLPTVNYSINDSMPPISSISASSTLGGGISVRWAATDNNPVFGVSYTTIYYRIGRSAAWRIWKAVTYAQGSDIFDDDVETLVNGTEYWFKCIAVDSAGNVENESDSNTCNITYIYRELPASSIRATSDFLTGVFLDTTFWIIIIALATIFIILAKWRKSVQKRIVRQSFQRKQPIRMEDSY